MGKIFWNIISTELNFTVNVPNEINGLEYLFQQEKKSTLFIHKVSSGTSVSRNKYT